MGFPFRGSAFDFDSDEGEKDTRVPQNYEAFLTKTPWTLTPQEPLNEERSTYENIIKPSAKTTGAVDHHTVDLGDGEYLQVPITKKIGGIAVQDPLGLSNLSRSEKEKAIDEIVKDREQKRAFSEISEYQKQLSQKTEEQNQAELDALRGFFQEPVADRFLPEAPTDMDMTLGLAVQEKFEEDYRKSQAYFDDRIEKKFFAQMDKDPMGDAIGLFDLFAAEAELAVTAIREAHWATSIVSPIASLKLGLELGESLGFIKTNPESRAIVRGETPLSFTDSVRALANINENRPVHEQVITGVLAPTNFIPFSWLGKGSKHILSIPKHMQPNSNMGIFKQIVENIPEVIGNNPGTARLYQNGKGKMLQGVMNPQIDIVGLPEGSLFEGDLRLWLNMGNEPLNLTAQLDEFESIFGQSGVRDSLQRLVDLGLVNKQKTLFGKGPEVFVKATDPFSNDSINILREMGHKVGVSGASGGREFVIDLLDMDTVFDSISTADDVVVRRIAKHTGINPSAAASTPTEKLAIAYARQTVSIESLVEVILQSQLDSMASRFRGKLPIKIDSQGIVEGTGMAWNDFFAIPLDVLRRDYLNFTTKAGVILTEDGFEYIRRYKQIIEEADTLRVENGLKSLAVDREGFTYIPRQAMSKGEFNFLKRSDPHQTRSWESATEAMIEKGIRYEVDPREVLAIHLKQNYRDVLDENLGTYMLDHLSTFTPRQYLEKIGAEVVYQVDEAGAALAYAKRNLRQKLEETHLLRSGRATVGTPAQAQKATVDLEDAYKQVEKAEADLKKVMAARDRAVKAIREAQPFNLWGDLPDEAIPASKWQEKLFPKEDLDNLRKGIRNIVGPANTTFRNLGRPVDTIKSVTATTDFAAPFLQGMLKIWSNPITWQKAARYHFAAFASPNLQAKLIRQNLPIFQEMAKYRIPMGDIEFFRALQKGRGVELTSFLDTLASDESMGLMYQMFGNAGETIARRAEETRIIVKRGQQATIGRFEASYSMYLTMSRFMIYKSLRDSFIKKAGSTERGLNQLAEYVKNLTGGLDQKTIGIGANQREIEGLFLAFSPKLLRSTVALFSDAFRYIPAEVGGKVGIGKGATAKQRESARTVASFLAGIHITYATGAFALYKSRGYSDDRIKKEIAQGLNPLSGKRYLSVDINGQWYGAGSTARSVFQGLFSLVGALGSEDARESFRKIDFQDNPALSMWASRGGIGLGLAQSAVEGLSGGKWNTNPYVEIDGPLDLVQHIATRSLLPMTLQGSIEGDSFPGTIVSVLGGRTSPATASDEKKTLVKDAYYELTQENIDEILGGTSEEHDHVAGVYPAELDSRLKKEIEKDPEIQDATNRMIDEGVSRGYHSADYKDELIKLKETKDEGINESFAKLNVGRELRNQIYGIKDTYRQALDDISNRPEYQETIEHLEEYDPKQPYNKDKKRFYQIMFSDDENFATLEDSDTGFFNHDEYDRRYDKAVEELGQSRVDAIENEARLDDTQIEKDLARDREFLAPYWNAGQSILSALNLTKRYDQYMTASNEDRVQMREGIYPGWELADWEDLSFALDEISDLKNKMLTGPVDLDGDGVEEWTDDDAQIADGMVWKWEYAGADTKFKHPENINFRSIDMKIAQGGRITNKNEIDKFLIMDGLNW